MSHERPATLLDRSQPARQTPLLLTSHAIDGFTADHLWASMRADERFARGSLVSVFHYDGTWSKRERHPHGDEMVFVLEGHAVFTLDRQDGDCQQVAVPQGHWYVIPRNTWHTASVQDHTVILFITPQPALTEEEPLPGMPAQA